jgi:glycerol-1-phosphate dehydrogenase [NAD(P)+]
LTRVVIAEDAVEQLVASTRRRALVIADANTFEALGARVVAALPDADELVFGQRTGLRPGHGEVERVRTALAGNHEVEPVAVGSGVITDIVRYGADLVDREFVSVPTAASMDGYASGVAALEIDGVKVTYPARAPRAIFADPRVCADAPRELTVAGIGDLLAKGSARVDWLAAHLLYGEPFAEQIANRVLEQVRQTAAHVRELLDGGSEPTATLLRGLVESGIAMALAGSSRPASGCEHHASHFWDLLAARGLRAYAPHGLQVGYATRFVLRLQRFAFGGGLREVRRPMPVRDPLGPEARAWLGEPTPEVVAAVEEKRRFAGAVPDSWPSSTAEWEAARAQIASSLEMSDPVDVALQLAGIPDQPGVLGIDERMLRATFRYATRLRARYTTVDFLEGQGALEEAIEVAFTPDRSPRVASDP